MPWDYRIPKIRIGTRQVDSLRDQRQVLCGLKIIPATPEFQRTNVTSIP